MSKKRDVTLFVNEVFDMYELNKYGFFYDFDENGNAFEIPLFSKYRIDNKTLNKISTKLGLTKEEILDCDMDAAKRYWNKYPFFRLFSEYLSQWGWSARYDQEKPAPEEILFHILFNEGEEYPAKKRYDYNNVKKRMIEQIKELDKHMSGAYHKEAFISKVSFETEIFMSFPQIAEMLNSFVNMVEYVKEHFFKAVRIGLNENEINEYNFLVNFLGATDTVMPSVLVTYDNICIYREAYLEEAYKDFYSYVKFGKNVKISPWRCKEFFDDMKLVNAFIDIFPESKAKMREFAMSVSQFRCDFLWSDSDEYMCIYVPKNKEEMFDWAQYVEKINQAIKPAAKGGLKIRERSSCTVLPDSLSRIERRVKVKNGGNK